uniref:NADH dehydrogenase subunit 4 n=1 Tax=Tenguna kuankuoshuiensis TaxID=3054878 RepID=UPI0026E3D5AC|nr:NADH dehydrogenase subunit 4 [Tenguna kuankuoshuiensis]WJE88880.1 NADH dehydrogenase subunit 4 [Tenguna kuankuoshuiensis]
MVCLSFFFFFFFFFFSFFGLFSYLSYGFFMDNITFIFCCLLIWICLLVLLCMLPLYFFDLSSFLFINLINFLLLFLFIDFIVTDFFQFYLFFECSLIPIFLILFGWGYQPERLSAGFFLIFYTLFGSFPFLLSIFYMNDFLGGFNYFFFEILSNYFLMVFITISFFIKFPLFGFHLWLPSAHVEAPMSGSMILAGVMLKLGGYGLIRCLSFLYNFFFFYGYFIISICLFGCIILSLFCLIQSDLKILIAYSSVCHMSLVISGICSMNSYGFTGSLMFMVGHGFVSSGLFYLVGLVYDRLSSRSFFILSGLMNLFPSMSLFWFLFCSMNLSCPPSLNLFSEICLIISLLSWSFSVIYFFFFILFFSACYSIMIFCFTQHGEIYGGFKSFKVFLVLEYYILLMHLFPVFGLVFGLSYFI